MDMRGYVDFDGFGFDEKKKCIYAIVIQNSEKKYVYIGRTGTSNKTGSSSPFERLATHLRKSAKTQSAFHDIILPSKIISKTSKIRFIYQYCKSDIVNVYEKYLIAFFKNQNEVICINKEDFAFETETKIEPLNDLIKAISAPLK